MLNTRECMKAAALTVSLGMPSSEAVGQTNAPGGATTDMLNTTMQRVYESQRNATPPEEMNVIWPQVAVGLGLFSFAALGAYGWRKAWKRAESQEEKTT